MPLSKCPKCDCTSFIASKKRVSNLSHEVTFIQCYDNNHVIGVIDTEYIQNLMVEAVDVLRDTIKKG